MRSPKSLLDRILNSGPSLRTVITPSDDVTITLPPAATGEAIHTSTFLGHPVGCAMALANITEIRARKLVGRSARLGVVLLKILEAQQPRLTFRGVGLMAGIELRNPDGSPASELALHAIKEMLLRGFILLPEGEHSNVISFSPPLTISEEQIGAAVTALVEVLEARIAPVAISSTATRKRKRLRS